MALAPQPTYRLTLLLLSCSCAGKRASWPGNTAMLCQQDWLQRKSNFINAANNAGRSASHSDSRFTGTLTAAPPSPTQQSIPLRSPAAITYLAGRVTHWPTSCAFQMSDKKHRRKRKRPCLFAGCRSYLQTRDRPAAIHRFMRHQFARQKIRPLPSIPT